MTEFLKYVFVSYAYEEDFVEKDKIHFSYF